jgi:hypothetical protein
MAGAVPVARVGMGAAVAMRGAFSTVGGMRIDPLRSGSLRNLADLAPDGKCIPPFLRPCRWRPAGEFESAFLQHPLARWVIADERRHPDGFRVGLMLKEDPEIGCLDLPKGDALDFLQGFVGCSCPGDPGSELSTAACQPNPPEPLPLHRRLGDGGRTVMRKRANPPQPLVRSRTLIWVTRWRSLGPACSLAAAPSPR